MAWKKKEEVGCLPLSFIIFFFLVWKKQLSPFALGGTRRHFSVRLLVFRQVSFLAEILTAERTGEGLLTRMRPDVNVDRVFVFETFSADAAVVKQSLPPAGSCRCCTASVQSVGRIPSGFRR